jgi:parvulin-like peptidyl-prolyl isomerase
VQASPTFMKSQGPLTIALSLSLAATSLMAADSPKKKPAAATPAAKTTAKPDAAKPDAPKPDDATAAKDTALPDPVAIVDGDPVKKSELEEAFANVLRARQIPADKIPAEERAEGYRMILDEIILDKLLVKLSAGTKVTDEEVAAKFETIKAQFPSEEELNKQLAAAGETVEKVKKGIGERLRQEHWLDEQIKGKAEITDAEAKDFYDKNIDQFKTPAQVRASHILIKVPEDAKPEVDAEKKKAATAIAARAKKGEPFDKLAKELSEDPTAKQNSGDLDFFPADQMVPEFSKAAFAMKKNEISDPVRSSFGYHVIKVTDTKDAETITLEKAKPQLVAYLQQQKKQTEVEKIFKDIRSKAEVKVNLPAAPAAAAPPSPNPAP